jgi:hypothetical protein
MAEPRCTVFVHRTALIRPHTIPVTVLADRTTNATVDGKSDDGRNGSGNGGVGGGGGGSDGDGGRQFSKEGEVSVQQDNDTKKMLVRTLQPCPNKGMYSLVVQDGSGLCMNVNACLRHARSASRLLALRDSNVSALMIVSGADDAKDDEDERVRTLEQHERVRVLEEQVGALKRDNRQLNTLVEALQRDYEDAKVTAHDTATETRATIAAKTTALQKERDALEDAEAKIAELERVNDELETQAERQTKRIATLQKRIAEIEAETE